MKTYELVFEQRQRPHEIGNPYGHPVAYVHALEPPCELDVTDHEDGTTEITLDHNGLWVRYEFTKIDTKHNHRPGRWLLNYGHSPLFLTGRVPVRLYTNPFSPA